MPHWQETIQYFMDASFYGIPVSNIGALLVILLVTVLFRKIFTRLVLQSLKSYTHKTKYHIDRLLVAALGRPLSYTFILLGLLIGILVLTRPIDTSQNEARLSSVQKKLQRDFEKKPRRKAPKYDLWKSLTLKQKNLIKVMKTLTGELEENKKIVETKEKQIEESFPVVPEKETPEFSAYEKLLSGLTALKGTGTTKTVELQTATTQREEAANRLKEFQVIPAEGDPRHGDYQALLKKEDSLATRLLLTRTANGWLAKSKKVFMALLKSFGAFIVFWIFYNLVSVLSFYLNKMTEKGAGQKTDPLVIMTQRCLRIFISVVGGVVIIQNLGYSLTSVLAGLGLGGLAFALAAKDTIGNFFGSIAVLVDRPFRVGDWIVVNGQEGTVEDVGFRSTRIRTFYDSQIVIPNAQIANATIDNMGRRRYRRKSLKLRLAYDTPPNKIEAFCEGVRELIRILPYTRKDYYHVFFNDFNESTLDVMLYFFVEVPDWTTELREWHRAFLCITKLASRLGVEFAFPTQTLNIPGLRESLGQSSSRLLIPKDVPGSGVDTPKTLAEAYELGRKLANEILRELRENNDDALPPSAVVSKPETLRTAY